MFTGCLQYLKIEHLDSPNNYFFLPHVKEEEKTAQFQFSGSIVSDSLRPHGPQHTRPPCPSPTPGVHPNPLSIESVMLSNHLILCHPLLLLPSIFPSIRVFSNESALRIRWLKYWFQFQHQSFQ